MQFVVSSSLLRKHLSQVASVITSSPALPILENFLFQLEPNKLTVVGTDLETTIKTQFEVKSEHTMSLCVPSKILTDSLKSFSEQPLTFEINHEKSRLTVRHTSGKFEVQCEESSSFPKEPTKQEALDLMLPARVLLDGISHTLFAVVQDELRPIFGGVLLECVGDQIRFVSTDGHRLVRFATTLAHGADTTCVIPKKSLGLLKGMLREDMGDVRLQLSSTHLFVNIKEDEGKDTAHENHITCRLLEGTYPKYESIIPENNKFVALLDRVATERALQRALLFANKSNSLVRFEFKPASDTASLFAENRDFAYNNIDSVPCTYEGEDLSIAFNGKLLVEMMQIFTSDKVKLWLSTESKGVLFKPEEQKAEGEDLLMLLMPLLSNY